MNNLCRSLILALAVVSAQPLLAKPQKWVGTWASSPLLDPHAKLAEETLTGTTLREVVHVSIGGDVVRVRFSNLYGTTPLQIGAAEIAQTLKGSDIVAGTGKALTFHGAPSVSIPAGALAVSDPIPFKFAPLSDLTVSFYLPSPSGPITEHQLGVATSFHATGNVVSSATLDSPKTLTSWEYLTGNDTLAPLDSAAVITIGDSITDGARSTVDANLRWPDELARRLQADPKYRNLSVL